MSQTPQPHVRALTEAIRQESVRYAAANPESQRQFEQATRVMPGGNTRSVLFYPPFPLTIARAEGCRLWDMDGHEYLDFIAEFTAGIYGHSHPVIRRAIDAALDNGMMLGGHNLLEAQLAALICRRFAGIEQVRFTNSGTEANLMALAAAKLHTQRTKIIVFKGGYHGAVLTFASGNHPVNVPHEFLLADYNRLASVQNLFDEYPGQIAAILVEPMQGAGGCIIGQPDFLNGLRTLASAHGTLLIFDEVMTSRLSAGGMQEISGITADLTTLGKYMGGGLPFGAFGGRADIMAQFDPRQSNATPHAGTFNNNVLSMAAGFAGLSQLYTASAARQLNERADRLRDQLNALCVAHGLALQFTGAGSIMNLQAGTHAIRSITDLPDHHTQVKDLFFFHMLEHGIYLARRGLIVLSLPIKEPHIQRMLDAFQSFAQHHGDILR